MEFYIGDTKNIKFEERASIIVGEELKTCGIENYIQPTDKIICVPINLSNSAKTVQIPDSVRHIGGKAFKYFTNLTEVHFSSNLETIGISAFLGCESLKNLHLPKTLKKIEAWAFGNIEVDNIYFDGSIFDFEKIKKSAKNMIAEAVRLQLDSNVNGAKEYINKWFVWDDTLIGIAETIKKFSKKLNGYLIQPLAEEMLKTDFEESLKDRK